MRKAFREQIDTVEEVLPSHLGLDHCQKSSWEEEEVYEILRLAHLLPNPSCSSEGK